MADDRRRGVEQQVWRSVEAVHAVVYFHPSTRETYERVGLRGFWMGYFASRSAALGPASPELVTALFHGFAPRMVRRALPDAWARASPGDTLAARAELARVALAQHTTGADVDDLVAVLDGVVDRLDIAGRPLAAAHAALPRPDDGLTRLWHLTTVLREYRGDGHVAALVAAEVSGAQSHIWHAASGSLPDGQQGVRGWTDDEWQAGRDALRLRGWLDDAGVATDAGRAARAALERQTDAVAAAAFTALPDDALRALLACLAVVAGSVVRAGAVPYPNAMGVPAPEPVPR